MLPALPVCNGGWGQAAHPDLDTELSCVDPDTKKPGSLVFVNLCFVRICLFPDHAGHGTLVRLNSSHVAIGRFFVLEAAMEGAAGRVEGWPEF